MHGHHRVHRGLAPPLLPAGLTGPACDAEAPTAVFPFEVTFIGGTLKNGLPACSGLQTMMRAVPAMAVQVRRGGMTPM